MKNQNRSRGTGTARSALCPTLFVALCAVAARGQDDPPSCIPPWIDHVTNEMTCLADPSYTFYINAWGTPLLTYQWRVDGEPIDINDNPSAGTAMLIIEGENRTHPIDCIVTNDCGSATSDIALFLSCRGNFNCDTNVDFFDYLDFVTALATMHPSADYNADGVIDFFDYLDFVDAFSAGC